MSGSTTRGSITVEATVSTFVVMLSIFSLIMLMLLSVGADSASQRQFNQIVETRGHITVFNSVMDYTNWTPWLTKFNYVFTPNISMEVDFKSIYWENDTETTYYVTDTGGKFHVAGCPHLNMSAYPMLAKEAIEKYGPCKICIMED